MLRTRTVILGVLCLQALALTPALGAAKDEIQDKLAQQVQSAADAAARARTDFNRAVINNSDQRDDRVGKAKEACARITEQAQATFLHAVEGSFRLWDDAHKRSNASAVTAYDSAIAALNRLGDLAIHQLLAGHSVQEAQQLQLALGKIRRVGGDFAGKLRAEDWPMAHLGKCPRLPRE